MKPLTALFWSGGKDSAYALYLAQKEYDVKYLVTTISKESERTTMHGINEELLEKQAFQTGIPLIKMWIEGASNDSYEKSFFEVITSLKKEGINHIVFGDLYLEDLRIYKDRILGVLDMKGIYPLWKKDTAQLIDEIRTAGLKAVTCSVDADFFSKEDAGKEIYDLTPGNFDPCGENGEYHSFCYDGPMFRNKVEFRKGEWIRKEYPLGETTKAFYFIDLY